MDLSAASLRYYLCSSIRHYQVMNTDISELLKFSFMIALILHILLVSSATGDASKAPTISSQKERQTVFPKSNLPIPEDVPEEIKDPCQTAEILEQPWRHWTYDDSEVPLVVFKLLCGDRLLHPDIKPNF